MQWSGALRMPTLIGVLTLGILVGVFVSGTVVVGQDPSATERENQKLLDELVVKDAIREQIYNYSRGLDRMDRELALQVWHADYLDVYGGTGAGFVDQAWRAHERIVGHTHQMTNILIKVDGDKAVSETYGIVSMRSQPTEDSASTSLIRGRYADAWSKRNGRWAIDRRVFTREFTTVDTSTGPNRPGTSRRDRTDPFYQVYAY